MKRFRQYKNLFIFLGIFIFFFFISTTDTFAANRYWVGPNNGDFKTNANWSTLSGGTGGASYPQSADTAIFDSGSNNCIIAGTNFTIGVVSITSGYSGTITNNVTTLTVPSFSQAGGTFTNNVNLSLSTTFSLSGGVFNAGPGVNVGVGTWTQSGGTYNHNNGTISFWGANTINVPTSITFYNLNLGAASGITITTTAGDTLIVEGTLTMCTYSVATVFTGGTIEARGNINILANTSGTTAIKVGGGVATTTWTGNTKTVSNSVEIAKTAGTVIDFGSAQAFFGGNFTITSGTVLAPSTRMHFSGAGWTQNGGVFTPNTGGYVSMNGNITLNVPTNITFYNFYYGGSTLNLSGDTVIVTNAFDPAWWGTAGGSTINNGTIEVQGNMVLSGNTTNGATGVFKFTGTADQSISGSFTSYNPVNIAKTGGTLTVTGMAMYNTLTFTSGTTTFSTLTNYSATVFNGGVVSGTFTAYSGNVTYNGGTLTGLSLSLGGSNAYILGTFFTVANLTVSKSNGAFINPANAVYITVTGTTTLSDGVISSDAGTYNGYILAQGNVVIGSGWDAGSCSGSLRFGGTNDQTVSASAGFCSAVYINKTGGTLNVGTWTVSSSPLYFQAGTTTGSLTASANNITYTAGNISGLSLTLSGGTKYIYGSPFTVANLTVSKTSGNAINLANAVTITVTGTTNLSDGVISTDDGTFNGYIIAQGNVTVGANWDAGSCYGSLRFTGSADQTVTSSAVFCSPIYVNKSSGTLNIGNWTSSGAMYFQAGTVTGNITSAGGNTITYNAGDISAVNLTVTGIASVFDVSPNGSATINSLNMNKAGSTGFYIGSSDTLIVTSTTTLTDGYFNSSASYTGILQAQGDVTIASTFDSTTAYGGLRFAGTANQNFSSAISWTGNVSVTKTAGTITNTTNIVLTSSAITVPSGATWDLNGFNFSPSGGYTMASGSTLRLKGSEVTVTSPTLSSGSTVEYYGTAVSQTIKAFNYANSSLIINTGATSVNSLAGNISVATTTITSGILYLAGYNLSSTVISNSGTLRLKGSETIASTNYGANIGVVEYIGDGDGASDIYGISNLPYLTLNLNSTDSADIYSDAVPLSITKYNNAIPNTSDGASTAGRIPIGTSGKGDDVQIYGSTIIKDGSIYKAWYSGYDGATYRIYYATSPDGLVWTKYNNTIPANSDTTSTDGRIPLGSNARGDDLHVYGPNVIKDGSTYKMWYSGHDGASVRIFYATSPDGLTWTKYNNATPNASDTTSTDGRVPLGTNTKGDDANTYFPSVILEGGTYKMWYAGNDGTNIRIYYATSPDGLVWTKYDNTSPANSNTSSTNGRVPLGTDTYGDDLHTYQPSVIKDISGLYFILYTGNDGTNARIYLASSPDGLVWTKYGNTTPSDSNTNSTAGRIPIGSNTNGDDVGTYCPVIIKDTDNYKIWYSGNDGTNLSLYYATSPFGLNINNDLNVSGGGNRPSGPINLGGSLVQTGGTLSMNYVDLILNGSNQALTILATTTLASLNKSVISADTLTFTAGVPLVVTGTTTLNGIADNILSLVSSSPETQWQFDPQGGRDFSYIDVTDSWNINAVEIDSSAITGFNDGGNNTGWGSSQAVVTVGKSGTQIATTTMPVTNLDLGGAFTLNATDGDADITSIKIKQIGSLATTSITNVELFYKEEVTCSTSSLPGGAVSFGVADAFDEKGIATTTGSLTLTDGVQTCLYIQYDLPDTYSTSTLGRSIDFEITNPATDLTVDGGAVTTSAKVNISGRTIVSTTDITSLLSLKSGVNAEDVTVFFLQNDAVWKMVNGGTPIRLTNTNLKVHSLTFSDFTAGSSGGTVKITMVISNIDAGTDPNFLSVTRTYTTTATVKAWGGND